MCGFAGFLGFDNVYPEKSTRLNLLANMAEPISRRGPDDQKLYDDGTLSFAFRRLSIVDLQSGQQPIWNEDETLFVSINGEIYNHRELRSHLKKNHQFRTKSDSEVVLHLYEEMGPRCLELLIGMFAIVIWDKSKKELFLARDRMGIKPLYYCQLKDGLIFGSELKALLAFPQCPRNLDWPSVQVGYSIPSLTEGKVSTYIKGINFLPGGSFAIVNKETPLKENKYWDLRNYLATADTKVHTPKYYVEEYARLIEDSVNLRLMSDVPIGSFLSGGLDSALITAIAAKKNKDIHCFHVLEEDIFKTGDSAAARKLVEQIGTPLHSVLFDSKKILDEINFSLHEFEYLVWMVDSPRFDLDWFFKHELHRYAKTKVPDIKVMLLGQGSDEFAGGYSALPSQNFNLKKEAAWEFWETEKVPSSIRANCSEDFFLGPNTPETNQQQMFLGRVKVLQGFNLWHEDRTSSAQGIESRVPFLDHRLVEFLVSIPSALYPKLFWDKYIVREAATKWIPKDLAHRPKIGFYNTSKQKSIWDLKRGIIKRVFPAFKKKYLGNPRSLFSSQALERLFTATQIETSAPGQAIDNLLSLMSIACFVEICQSKPNNFLSVLKPPSPLIEVGKGWAEKTWMPKTIKSKKKIKPLHKTDPVELVNPSKAVFQLPDTIRFQTKEDEVTELELTSETNWILGLIRFLVRDDYTAQNCLQLAKKLNVPLTELEATASLLVKMGVLTIREKTSKKQAA